MNLTVSMYSEKPIYEQLEDQIKQKILHKELKETDQLPSIRTLSKELQIGIVTVKRAYDDLVNEGYIMSKAAKGYFVLPLNIIHIQSSYIEKIDNLFNEIKRLQKEADIEDSTIKELWENKGEQQ